MNNQQWQSMTNEEQVKWWAENAPGGATHARLFEGRILWINDPDDPFKNEAGWPLMRENPLSLSIKKPEQQPVSEWNGEGLPPVGEEVEYTTTEYQEGKPSIKVGTWYCGTVIAYHDGVVWTSDNGLRMLRVTEFRPVQTREQREREELVSEFVNHLRRSLSTLTSEYQRQIAEDFIDSGWRIVK